jgi:hypothetical protein
VSPISTRTRAGSLGDSATQKQGDITMRLTGTLFDGIDWYLDRSSCEPRLYLEFRDKNNKRLLINDVSLHFPAELILAKNTGASWLDTDAIGEEWTRIFTLITKIPVEFLEMVYRAEVNCA